MTMWRTYVIFNLIFVISPSTSNLYSFDCDCNRTADHDVSKTLINIVNFQTNTNTSCYAEECADKIINSDAFDPEQCVHVFVPGFMTTNTSLTSKICTCSLSTTTCKNGKKPLVLVVDHSKYLNGYFLQKVSFVDFYKSTVKFVKPIGILLGKVLIPLLRVISRSLINILGHSLGAHIVGYAGAYIQQQNQTALETVYAVDPAGPCYQNCPAEHVKATDAKLLIVTHTNEGMLGTNLNLAHFDLYAHDGVHQEECNFISSTQISNPVQNFCNHKLAVPFSYTPYALNSGWRAVKCPTAEAFLKGDCDNNESIMFGYGIIPNGTTGTYFFEPKQNLVCVNGPWEIYFYAGRSFFSEEIDDTTNVINSIKALL